MKCIAKGIAYHHFWGEYCCEIYLDFNSSWQAEQAAKVLGWKFQNCSTGIFLKNEETDTVVDKLVELGADRSKILSLEHSIDTGDPFEISIELEHPDQLKLAI